MRQRELSLTQIWETSLSTTASSCPQGRWIRPCGLQVASCSSSYSMQIWFHRWDSKKITNLPDSFTVTHQIYIRGNVININIQDVFLNIQWVAKRSAYVRQGVLWKGVLWNGVLCSSRAACPQGRPRGLGGGGGRDETSFAAWAPGLMSHPRWICMHIIRALPAARNLDVALCLLYSQYLSSGTYRVWRTGGLWRRTDSPA